MLKPFQISNLGLKKMKQGLSPGMDLDNIEVSHSQRRMSTISQLCTNALRKTRSQDKVAFWRLLTSSRQSRPQASKRRKRHQASHGNGSASNTTSAPQLAASGKPQLVHVLARIAREETSCNEEVPELDQLPIAKMRKEFAPREEPGS